MRPLYNTSTASITTDRIFIPGQYIGEIPVSRWKLKVKSVVPNTSTKKREKAFTISK
jgi:hypothetical protein